VTITDGDIIRITAKMSQGLSDIQNVYHLQLSTSGPVADATFLGEIADDIDSMYDDLISNIADNVTFDTIQVYNVTQDEYIGETSWPSQTDGGAASDMLPPQTAPLVLFSTPYLKSQGRKFLPPFTINAVDDDGTIDTAPLAQIVLFIVDVLTQKSGVNWTGYLGNWNKDLARFAQWLEGTARDFFATQRRRYTGYGS
jgi:hypothetical protein